MRISLSSMPSRHATQVIDFPRLDGGLNLWELEYRLDGNQSPEMKNLWWQDGALQCRDGQEYVLDQELGTGYTCFGRLFWDHAFCHIGNKLYRIDLLSAAPTAQVLLEGVPENRGTFFRYGDALFYKNRGGYYKISYHEGGTFTAGAVEVYTPITYINMEPTTHAGDEYQPENRLCPTQTVWYSVVQGVTVYHLPVTNLDSVDKVVVDDVELTEGYTVDLAAGTVTFATEPKYHDPYVANTVKITFTKANEVAYNSVMDCPYAAAFGGDQNVCVVVGGCPAQPNAYFWSGNHSVMDPGYFPFEQYNFAGDTEEPITGFGKQQNLLVIFKERSLGRAEFGTVEMASGRVMLTMNYTRINDRIGCDLPWSIQLVENNLVFCNTENGVYLLKDSSSAYENNVESISRNVNGTSTRAGLLKDTRTAGVDATCSYDDDNHYWLCANGHVYVWDYQLSSYKEPSWFYMTNINGIAYLRQADKSYHMDAKGRLTRFARNLADYGAGIEKVYQFPTQSFGSYDRLKDVLSVIFTVRSDTNSVIDITYISDYETRKDLTQIWSLSGWSLVPRNLAIRNLGAGNLAHVARRKPGCRHVRHFSMRLTNNTAGQDIALLSAQIFFRYLGRDR